MNRDRIALATIAALTVGALLSCKQHPPTTAATVQPVKVAGPTEAAVSPPPPAKQVDRDAEVLAQDLATLNRKGYLVDAFFDFQKAELREDARAALSKDAEWLRKFPSIEIVLEGHCDDRGTEAYNLALGEQRARVVGAYLASLGISERRVRTVSYGKEKPFCSENSERCWQENRRAHFLVAAK